MTEFEKSAERPEGINLATLEHMLSVGGPALRPALITQILADLGRLSEALSVDHPAQTRKAAHELKGIAATIGADSLAEQATALDRSLEWGKTGNCSEQIDGVRRQIDDLAVHLQAEYLRVPAA